MDVHLRELRYFLAVAEELHFTRAAERLFVSQPALSKQIKALEQQLRTPLFVRGGRSVQLTAAGTALLPHARATLAAWDGGRRAVGAALATERAELTVGFLTSLGRGLLRQVTERFGARQPGWRLTVRQVSWADASGGLADHSVDAAFLWLPVPDPGDYEVRVLATECRLVALPAGHRLAGAGTIPFAELLDEPFLALPLSAGALRAHWLAEDSRQGRPARIGGTVSTAEETFEGVAAGTGIALLSAGNAGIYRHPDVLTRPVSGIPHSELAVAWRRGDDRPATRDFVLACAEAAAAIVGPPDVACAALPGELVAGA